MHVKNKILLYPVKTWIKLGICQNCIHSLLCLQLMVGYMVVKDLGTLYWSCENKFGMHRCANDLSDRLIYIHIDGFVTCVLVYILKPTANW